MSKEKCGPAFPELGNVGYQSDWQNESGMSLRQYAAIKLKVPDSGTDWLDEMILQSLRDALAMKAMEGTIAGCREDESINRAMLANWVYQVADAMLEARKVTP